MAPVTTYTHTTRDAGVDTVSSANEERLPPGGFNLHHGFPEWSPSGRSETSIPSTARMPHIVEVLQYLRIAFDVAEMIDSVELSDAANTGAWHAWQSYRAKIRGKHTSRGSSDRSSSGSIGSPSGQQQPGGARRPGEWNWQGVWEDRVRKSIIASNTENALYGGDGNSVV